MSLPGWLGPSVIKTVTVDQGVQITDSKISLLSPELSTSQQQLWLQIETHLGHSNRRSDASLQASVSMQSVSCVVVYIHLTEYIVLAIYSKDTWFGSWSSIRYIIYNNVEIMPTDSFIFLSRYLNYNVKHIYTIHPSLIITINVYCISEVELHVGAYGAVAVCV